MSIEGKKGKIELNLDTSKKLYEGSPEDIILKSPYRIPAKGINNVLALKGINNQEYAYYDISKTEQQAINFRETITKQFFDQITELEFYSYIGNGPMIDENLINP